MRFDEDEIDIYISPNVPLDYYDWFYLNEESLIIEFSMTGLDEDIFFDFEIESKKRYESYLIDFEFVKKKRLSLDLKDDYELVS